MELLFIWTDIHYVLENIGFNFSNKFQIIETTDQKNLTIHLELIERPDYVQNFFPGNVKSISAIVGENGVGKSSLLDLIVRINHCPETLAGNWVAVYLDHQESKIKAIGHLINEREKSRSWKITRSHQISSYSEFKRPQTPFSSSDVNKILSIFYNPSLDLKSYKEPCSDLARGFVDVSTNFLVLEDFEKKSNDEIDQIENHRFKNVYRQFELSQSRLVEQEDLRIPSVIEVRFNKNRRVEEYDLSRNAKGIYLWFESLGQDKAQDANHSIEIAHGKYPLEDYKRAYLEKVKVWFIRNVIYDYFTQLSKIKDLGGELFNIELGEFQTDNLLNSAVLFFDKQAFTNNSNYKISEFLYFVIDVIERFAITKGTIADNDSFFEIPVVKAIEIHQAHLKYINLFQSKSRKRKDHGFLDFNWRDLSNGEKAYLDLYSRLFFGYRKFESDVLHSSILYVIIDEGELGFHPQWQKEYIFKLIKFLNKLSEGLAVQLIITSHSPFVLSDLPKSNVILLNKNESKKTFVDQLKAREQTFAANIHELFSDSFFMKNGTIGDFAKSKIEYLVALFGSSKQFDELEKSRIKKLIQLIGEPLIRDRLLDMYREKFTTKETIEEKIARLKGELKNAEDSIKNIQ